MQVFKLFFHIINKNKFGVFMVLFITFGISVLFVSSGGNNQTNQKVKIAIIDQDNTEASQALTAFLKENTSVKEIKKDSIEESLFYRNVEYVLYIPSGFENKLQSDQEIVFEKNQIPQSMSAYVADSYVQNFTNTLRNYVKYSDKSMTQAIEQTKSDMSLRIEKESIKEDKPSSIQYYFNFLAYTVFSVLISGIAIIMIALNKSDIRRRNTIAPISNLRMNALLGLASSIFAIVLFALITAYVYIVFQSATNSLGFYLYIVNLSVLLLPALGLAYLISSTIKNAEAISGVSNIVCLSLAFLGGSFVSQSMLSDAVLSFARFTPTYWFVNNNDKIAALTSLDSKYVQPIYMNMLIMVGFAVVFFIITLFLTNHQRKNIV